MDSPIELLTGRYSQALNTALRRCKPIPRFMRDKFVRGRVNTHSTDVIRADRLGLPAYVLPFVSDTSDPIVLQKSAREIAFYPTPRLLAEVPTPARDILFLSPEGNIQVRPGADFDIDGKINETIADDFAFLKRSFSTTTEHMLVQVLTTGKLTGKDEASGFTFELDYRMPDTHKIVLPDNMKWGADGANPIAQFEEFAQILLDSCGLTLDTAVHGSQAWEKFSNNSFVKEALANRRINSGTMQASVAKRWKGNPLQIDQFVYGGSDPDVYGKAHQLFPKKGVLLACSDAHVSIEYGLPSDLTNRMPTQEYLTYDINRKGVSAVGESRPLPFADMRCFIFIEDVVGGA